MKIVYESLYLSFSSSKTQAVASARTCSRKTRWWRHTASINDNLFKANLYQKRDMRAAAIEAPEYFDCCCWNRKRATLNDATRRTSCRGGWALKTGNDEAIRGRRPGRTGIAKFERGGEWRWDAAFSLAPCLFLSLFCGRSNGYQIFAAPLANNASLDKPESLFTIAGYSFIAFFLGS